MKNVVFAVILVLLYGCGGEAFTTAEALGEDSGTAAGGATGSAPGSTGGTSTGGSVATADGASETSVPKPPCCVDADCPASIPFCSPWGTCYQGGDPYNCDYDSFCESFCVHCSGNAAGACEEKRCVCF